MECSILLILEFIFQSFWHWLGTFFLLSVIVGGIAEIVRRPFLYVNKKWDNE